MWHIFEYSVMAAAGSVIFTERVHFILKGNLSKIMKQRIRKQAIQIKYKRNQVFF